VPRKKYKARSYIGFDNPVTIKREEIDKKIEELEEQIERLEEAKEKAAPTVEVVAAPPKAAPPKAGAKKGRPPRTSVVAEILAKK
jgi:hypothetical protein